MNDLQTSIEIPRGRREPCRGQRLTWVLLLFGAVCGARTAHGAGVARAAEPVTRIELEAMGYEGLQPDYMMAGSPMLTVDFVDDNHLLVTFEVRRLMKREKDAPADDADRTVKACLVEISSGRVLASTEWRLHDRAQYLWNLGGGRFLLRVHDDLTVFTPMRGRPEDAFQMSPFLETQRRIIAILLSADRDLLTIESVKRPDARVGDIAVHVGAERAPVQLNFYRLKPEGGEQGKLLAISAGAIRTPSAVALPLTTTGYLDILQGGKNTWLFNFDEHAGKVRELLAFDTTCFPRPVFVGHDQFVVFGCKGGDERRMFAGFNLRGEEMWQQGFYESYIAPTFSFAPAAGRFALGRVIVGIPMADDAALTAGAISSQEVRVYQTYSGRMLFRIDCTPVERSGHNFDLSPDGMRLAVIREAEVRHKATKDTPAYTGKSTGVELYALLPLTDQDRSEVRAMDINSPADTGAPIDEALARLAASKSDRQAKTDSVGQLAPAEQATEPSPEASVASGAQQQGTATAAGDPAESAEPRKPPTLYGPDEKPQDKPNK